MKLVYFWVEEHLCFKNQGFHFTNRYKFSFERDEKGYCLNVDKIKDDMDVKLFFDAPLSDLRIFVGENGRGKTILFKLIESTIKQVKKYDSQRAKKDRQKRLIVFEKENQGNSELFYCLFGIEEIQCDPKLNIKVEKLEEKPVINQCFFYNVPEKIPDIEKQIAFICKETLSDWMPFSLPRNLEVIWEDEELLFEKIYKKLNNLKNKTIDEEKVQQYKWKIDGYRFKIVEKLSLAELSLKEQEFFKRICWTIFRVLTKDISWREKEMAEYTCREVENFQQALCKKMDTFSEWDALKEILTSLSKTYSQFKHLTDFVNLLLHEIKETDGKETFLRLHNRDEYAINNDMVDNLIRIYKAYCQVNMVTDFHFMNFLWELSSGEYAMLNTFAHIYDARKECNDEERDLLIFLDEIDLSLHPKWQQKYMDFLTRMLRECFNDKRIQLVLATHSPIILSDIHSQFVTYLVQEENTIYSHVSENKKRLTYGANIFDIYKDVFYLTQSDFGFIGAVAAKKIREVLKNLTIIEHALNLETQDNILIADFEDDNRKLDECIKIINMIDDPVLRGLLRERLSSIQKMLFKKKEFIMLLETLSESDLQQIQSYIKKKESN